MEAKMCIMIVEDDRTLSDEIRCFLNKWGYRAMQTADFANVLMEVMTIKPQLVLLDINLPYYDGFYWCRKIREQSEIPIIYISSRGDDKDKIMAIAQGGDDYVEKPFRLELLKAKIEAILRRTYQYRVKERVYLNEELRFDIASMTLFYKGAEVELTKSEKRIMSKLLQEKPDVVSRETLMVELWDTDEFVSDSTLTTMISRLRSKLKEGCGEELIGTKKGQGYYIS